MIKRNSILSHPRSRMLRLLTALPIVSFFVYSTPEPSLVPLGANSYRFDWTGEAGMTYFLQYSQDLQSWSYFPLIEHGLTHPPLDVTPLDTNNNPLLKYFMRMISTDIPTTDPDGDDFDGDGISNITELRILGTDPLAFTPWADSDTDGLPYSWEVFYWGNLTAQSGTDDADSDGLTNADELAMGTDPSNNQTSPTNASAILYDSVGRLTDSGVNSWSYDAEGNLESAQ